MVFRGRERRHRGDLNQKRNEPQCHVGRPPASMVVATGRRPKRFGTTCIQAVANGMVPGENGRQTCNRGDGRGDETDIERERFVYGDTFGKITRSTESVV